MTPSRIGVWIMAARPKTLGAAAAPVIMGSAMAFGDGKFRWIPAVLTLLCALLIQVGTNIANDYFDYQKGADRGERVGPVRVTQAGLVSPRQSLFAFCLVFSLSFLIGLYLVWIGGIPILIIGIASICFGILYTGGPFPLGYKGLADIFVLIFFGPVAVGGTYYIQALEIALAPVVAGFSPGLFSVAILTVNNFRDIETDRRAGKHTLAVRFGKTFAKAEYLLSLVVACLIPVLVSLIVNNYALLSCLMVMFIAAPLIIMMFREIEGTDYNKMLAQTGALLLLFSILFSIGYIF